MQELGRLIRQLDKDEPQKRREAHKKLEALGWNHPAKVIKMLQKELAKTTSFEVKHRIKELLTVFSEGRWDEQPLPEAPISGRYLHTAIWTGKEIIIWGGFDGTMALADGASYEPKKEKWEKLPESPIKSRCEHTAIWTGKSMIIFGGMGASDSASYDPETKNGEDYLKHRLRQEDFTQPSGQVRE